MRRVTLPGRLRLFGSKAAQAPNPDLGGPIEDPVVILQAPCDSGEKGGAQLRGGPSPASIGREPGAPGHARQGRSLLVSYGGEFLGIYHAPGKITNRKAYGIVAAVLREELPDFDPERLELHRPVRLPGPPVSELLSPPAIGRFKRFEKAGSCEPVA